MQLQPSSHRNSSNLQLVVQELLGGLVSSSVENPAPVLYNTKMYRIAKSRGCFPTGNHPPIGDIRRKIRIGIHSIDQHSSSVRHVPTSVRCKSWAFIREWGECMVGPRKRKVWIFWQQDLRSVSAASFKQEFSGGKNGSAFFFAWGLFAVFS